MFNVVSWNFFIATVLGVVLTASCSADEEKPFTLEEKAVLENAELRGLTLAFESLKDMGFDANNYKLTVFRTNKENVFYFEAIEKFDENGRIFSYEVWVNDELEVTRANISK